MQRLGRSKLFVIEYSFDTKWPTFILADNMEDALRDHRSMFSSHHHNIKLIQFLSAAPLFTEKIAGQEFFNAVQASESDEEE